MRKFLGVLGSPLHHRHHHAPSLCLKVGGCWRFDPLIMCYLTHYAVPINSFISSVLIFHENCCHLCDRARCMWSILCSTTSSKYFSFRLCTTFISLCFGCSSSEIDAFVLYSIWLSLSLPLSILLYAVISNAVNLCLCAVFTVRVSNPYNHTGHTKATVNLCFICCTQAGSFYIPQSL